MDQLKKVKLLYLITVACFLFICWDFAAKIIFKVSYDYKMLVLFIIILYVLHLTSLKISRFSKILSLFYKNEYLFQQIEQDVKKGIIIVSIIGLLQWGQSTRFCLIYFVISILLLRESRAYSYNIKSSRYTNLIIAAFSLIMSMDIIFSNLVKLLFHIIEIIWIPLQYIFEKMLLVIGFLLQIISKILSRRMKENTDIHVNTNTTSQVPVRIENNLYVFPTWAKTVIEIIVFFIFVFIVYKVYSNLRRHKVSKDIDSEVNYEKIPLGIKKHKKKVNYGKDLKGKILSIFYNFEKNLEHEKQFHVSLTAEELGKIAKIVHGEDKKYGNVDKIVNVYNKAKFSNVQVDLKDYNTMKEANDELKK